MRASAAVFVLTLLLAAALPLRADTGSEIEYLLAYVERSGCAFQRNGDTYDSRNAREHIQRKLDYIRRWASGRIRTAEDFIELAATRSSLSGELYTVECDGRTVPSGEWLLSALERYRSGAGRNAAGGGG